MSVKRPIRTNILVALGAIIALAGVFSSNTFAETAPVTSATNVLKVTPVRSDINVAPGTSKTVQVTLTNLTKAAITVSAIENDFVAGDEKGTPALILDADTYAPTHSLKRFLAPIGNVTVPAGDSKTINVVVTVPKDAQSGGYFGAVRFAPSSTDTGGQVNLSASVASLMLLTVPGPTVEKLNMTEFEILQDGKPGTFFNNPTKLSVHTRFENKGNLQEAPFGKISILQGGKTVYSTDFNIEEPRQVVLPDSARQWDVPLEKIGDIGYYTLTATFTYGQSNQTIEVSKNFWVIPVWLIITAAATFVVLVGVVILVIFLIRRKRRRKHMYGRRGGHLKY